MVRADAEDLVARRTRMLYWCVVAVVGLFIGRLYFLQVVSGQQYLGDSQSNSRKLRSLAPPRGLMLDRKGRLLVGNRESYDLVVDRERVEDWDRVEAWVSQVAGTPDEALRAQWKKKREEGGYRPVVLAHDLAFSQVAFVEARREDCPAVRVETETVRTYPHEGAAHVLGYVAEVDAAELKKPEIAEYHQQRDLIGKSGLERQYDRMLSGTRGLREVIVNNVGKEISSTILTAPVRGTDLVLTLDLDVQEAAERGLAGRRGACVALDPRSGEILAMASSPAYDPNAFVGGISPIRWKQYHDDPHDPLQFRAVAGVYPPGSVFKVLVSAATLESGTHDPSFSVTCRGQAVFGDRVRHCWKEEGHGGVNMHLAMQNSCNIFYYTTSRDTGITAIERLAKQVGFGRLTGVDVPGERGGLMPGEAWKRQRFKEPWYPGDTINVGIGQGFLGVTPMQVALFAMATANGGRVYRPHLLKRALDPVTGAVVQEETSWLEREISLKPSTVAFLHSSMEDVVERGTGRSARVPGIRVAGKTGTAQPSSGEAPKGTPREERAERYQEHAWFMGFAPVDNPEIAVAVVFEHAGLHGGEIAAPLARQVMEAWFRDRVAMAGQ